MNLALFQLPQIIGYTMRIYPRAKLRETFLENFFAGKHISELQTGDEHYCHSVIPEIIRSVNLPSLP